MAPGVRLVLCHGCFDILHVGHFQHLRQARLFGDRLVVSITAAAFIHKGRGHPAHTDAERLEQLAALRFVDEVYLSQEGTGAGAILLFRPHFYVRGADYAQGGIGDLERSACKAVGAVLRYTNTPKRSAIQLVRAFEEFKAR